jgi:hypothetical protein
MTHDLDLVKLKQMLADGVPGRKILAETGVVISAQVAYARAWGIERKLGRPKRTADELSDFIGKLLRRTDDNDVVFDALARTLRILATTDSRKLKSVTRAKLEHFASAIADLKE